MTNAVTACKKCGKHYLNPCNGKSAGCANLKALAFTNVAPAKAGTVIEAPGTSLRTAIKLSRRVQNVVTTLANAGLPILKVSDIDNVLAVDGNVTIWRAGEREVNIQVGASYYGVGYYDGKVIHYSPQVTNLAALVKAVQVTYKARQKEAKAMAVAPVETPAPAPKGKLKAPPKAHKVRGKIGVGEEVEAKWDGSWYPAKTLLPTKTGFVVEWADGGLRDNLALRDIRRPKAEAAPKAEAVTEVTPVTADIGDDHLISLAKVCGFDEDRRFDFIWDSEGVLRPRERKLIASSLVGIGCGHFRPGQRVEHGFGGDWGPVMDYQG